MSVGESVEVSVAEIVEVRAAESVEVRIADSMEVRVAEILHLCTSRPRYGFVETAVQRDRHSNNS
jgi:hypothetical protein